MSVTADKYMTTPITDHEAILLITQKVDTIHQEMKDGFANLQNNYASRLDNIEKAQEVAYRVFIAKEEQDKINKDNETTFAVIEADTDSLKMWRSFIVGGLSLVGLIVALACYTYITQQSVQDTRIDNLTKQVNHIPQ